MKETILLFSIWCGGLLDSGAQAQPEPLQNVEAVTAAGEYSHPVWSPDGTRLLFTEAHNEALFVLDLRGDRRVEKLKEGTGIGYLAAWSDDGRQVLYREQNGDPTHLNVKSIDLTTRQEKPLPHVHPDNLRQASPARRAASAPLIVYINLETLQLEAKRGTDGTPWVVTPEAGQFYQPVVSPDERSVVVHEGAHMYLYSLLGKGTRQDLGIGLATSWHPDGQGVLTFEDQSADGHTITASELFMVGRSSAAKVQLTHSDDRIETWGDISPDGKRIAFSDEKSGKIFVADLALEP